MIEYWDIYDENRNKTGRIYRRGDEMQSGDYHLVIHVCIFNSKNELLIQRRHPDKIGWPGIWDISAAGSALQDEDSRMAAIREVKEELGIEIILMAYVLILRSTLTKDLMIIGSLNKRLILKISHSNRKK